MYLRRRRITLERPVRVHRSRTAHDRVDRKMPSSRANFHPHAGQRVHYAIHRPGRQRFIPGYAIQTTFPGKVPAQKPGSCSTVATVQVRDILPDVSGELARIRSLNARFVAINLNCHTEACQDIDRGSDIRAGCQSVEHGRPTIDASQEESAVGYGLVPRDSDFGAKWLIDRKEPNRHRVRGSL